MQTQSLTMNNVCNSIRVEWENGRWEDVVLMGGRERGMLLPLTSRKFAYSPPTGKVPPKVNFYSAPSKAAFPTTE